MNKRIMEEELLMMKNLELCDFHQKCYISHELFRRMDVSLGSFVEIQTETMLYLCSIWPHHVAECRSISLNPTVSKCHIEDMHASHQNMYTRKIQDFEQPLAGLSSADDGDGVYRSQKTGFNVIQVLNVKKATEVTVDVILNKLEHVSKIKKSKHLFARLHTASKDLMFRLCVKNEFVIDCSHSKLAKLSGILYIVVKEAKIGNVTGERNFGCIMNKRTSIIVNSVHSKEWYDQFISSCNEKYKKPGGLDSVIGMLEELIRLPFEKKESFRKLGAKPPRGVLLYGPPGCGKTSMVRYIAAVNKIFLVNISGVEAFGPRPGETENYLRQIFKKARLLSEEGACVLFIDEIDSLCPKRVKSGGVQEMRATAQLLSLMDCLSEDDDIFIIGASNRPSELDPALRRPGRLDREVIINPPNILQRLEILTSKVKDIPVSHDLDLKSLAEVTNGYVGADLVSLCKEAAYLAMTDSLKGRQCLVCQEHFVTAIKKIRPSLQKGAEGIVDLRPVHWTDIGGLDDVKLQIQQAVEWPLKHPEAFARLGLKPPGGVLLYGPPGCCKTTLVRAAATACHCTFLSISGAQLYSPYVGDSERLLSEVFQKARVCSPSILFLDEIDSIIGKRSESRQHGVHERILSTLLNEMDGIGIRLGDGEMIGPHEKQLEGFSDRSEKDSKPELKEVSNRSVLVVAATNRPDLLDSALIRPGRMDKIIFVPPPDLQARKDILLHYTKNMKLVDCDLDLLASRTDMYTGADLEALCREAALHALTEDLTSSLVSMDHFLQALTSIRPSLDGESLQLYTEMLKFRKQTVHVTRSSVNSPS